MKKNLYNQKNRSQLKADLAAEDSRPSDTEPKVSET